MTLSTLRLARCVGIRHLGWRGAYKAAKHLKELMPSQLRHLHVPVLCQCLRLADWRVRYVHAPTMAMP